MQALKGLGAVERCCARCPRSFNSFLAKTCTSANRARNSSILLLRFTSPHGFHYLLLLFASSLLRFWYANSLIRLPSRLISKVAQYGAIHNSHKTSTSAQEPMRRSAIDTTGLQLTGEWRRNSSASMASMIWPKRHGDGGFSWHINGEGGANHPRIRWSRHGWHCYAS